MDTKQILNFMQETNNRMEAHVDGLRSIRMDLMGQTKIDAPPTPNASDGSTLVPAQHTRPFAHQMENLVIYHVELSNKLESERAELRAWVSHKQESGGEVGSDLGARIMR